jgi:hypothetical protein
LGGRVDVLAQDALDHPDRYDERTRLLLADLGEKRDYQPNGDELKALDRATLDFAEARPPRPTTPPVLPQNARKPAQRPRELLGGDFDSREPTVEAPGGVLSAYWWL